MLRSIVRLQCQLGSSRTLLKYCSRDPASNFSIQSNAYSSAMTERRKFYKDVSIAQGEGGVYEVHLDRRKLKTPGGKLFTVPNESLAVAVATEWDAQKETLKYYSMHLTTLCNTAIDNPTHRDKQQMITASLKFVETDTVCYRIDDPPALVELQKNEWDPVLHWIENRYNVEIGSSYNILGPEIPAATIDTFRQHLNSYNFWSLTGLEFVITQLKSVVLSLALIDRHLTVEEAVLLSRLEEEYQIERWGSVEWCHDYDMYELRARTAAGALFVQLSSEMSSVKRKLMQDC
ncbi:ATP synthase mitochondrial F1 complex assembly factor 2 [Gadus morhua]|uniref:ATP synthase mitochondrial F1 complex assembly factor 2 n=1 Tax=Gadus morhua TaxID=8049 RepID=A0A8C4Z4D8_GADMO|nr:ATP synthase mitochondrial F1 complex assembly factor 2 [Gadus morhua]XP_056432508.1 ATP synthase mitochondrial F1 complex assembly factor 2 [Gadus chalcogrammus]